MGEHQPDARLEKICADIQQAHPHLEQADREALAARRLKLEQPSTSPLWAIAFSGGGIRSATFCLGLARSLAKKEVWKRFDYLSTVSGGGYTGSALGRLYSDTLPDTADPAKVEKGIAEDRSLFLWWLRSNGRFLLPAGFADLLLALTGLLRGIVSTQFEVAILCLLLSGLAISPHLGMGYSPGFGGFATATDTPWWTLTLWSVPLMLVVYFAFWFRKDTREGASVSDLILVGLLVAITLIAGACLHRLSWEPSNWAPWLAVTLTLFSVVVGWMLNRFLYSAETAGVRLKLTTWLAWMLAGAVGLLVIGLLDMLSWTIAEALAAGRLEFLAGGAGATAGLAILLRVFAPMAAKFLTASGRTLSAERLAHSAGLLLSVLTFTLYLILAQWWVFFWRETGEPPLCGEGSTCLLTLIDSPLGRWAVMMGVLLAYAILSGRNLGQLNGASLHNFYRSRLSRAYVAVGNFSASTESATGTERFIGSPIADYTSVPVYPRKISDPLATDDVSLRAYTPHRLGGPIHVLNCCINQSRDDRTGNYNADRKGINLGVSSLGWEVSNKWPVDFPPLADSGLSQWVAMSGAAVGSGMGSLTRSGLAAISFLSGVRLGYWWSGHPNMAPDARAGRFAKYCATVREWFGSFAGFRDHALYISDGGHFDNTGVYALLKRQPELIVLADCGADPRYAFSDVENLVRKARIDYRTEIEFVVRPSVSAGPELRQILERLVTPPDMASSPDDGYLLLARIRYPTGANGEPGRVGALLVIKPRHLRGLPVDVAGYADRDINFPQQTTADQFFDESQWESYCQLGLWQGNVLSEVGLQQIIELAKTGTAASMSSLVSEAPSDAPRTAISSSGIPTEAAATAAPAGARRTIGQQVGQTLGIGALLTVLFTGWQSFDESSRASADAHQKQQQQIAELLGLQTTSDVENRDATQGSVLTTLLQANTGAGDGVTDLVTTLERFGVVYGEASQEAARKRVVSELSRLCTDLVMRFGQKPETENCRVALATLDQPRPSRWQRWVRNYQRAIVTAEPAPPGECRLNGSNAPTELIAHLYEPADRAAASTLLSFITESGLPWKSGSSAALLDLDQAQRNGESAGGEKMDRARLGLITHPRDKRCAKYIERRWSEQHATATPDTAPFVVLDVTGFDYTAGNIQVIALDPVLEASVPDAPASTTAPATPASTAIVQNPSDKDILKMAKEQVALTGDRLSRSPASAQERPSPAPVAATTTAPASAPASTTGTATGSLSTPRTLYIQFKGNFTRAEVDALRKDLADKFSNPRLYVPAAERIGARYSDQFKYFNARARGDAIAVLDAVEAYFDHDKKWALAGSLDLTAAQADGDPEHLELWIEPIRKTP